ncbi:sushi, von Willebrand factor type A, EGF and pentraxin domain-containing protein 1-like [Strongylocentrotus purpuratus]|uniref:Sushi domain-containing protein n=1 Tax=Strongylocentrotus purpuratus TaxID=7668 RepID=A0A7M7P070_STRPU|nr:sushi, von Willebrand factor type A, EGF and pentraxin domain-containing protein 1-like [Strongylocentrotus purpuratus]
MISACARPTNPDPNLVIDPDKTSYGDWAHIAISCSPGYEMTGPGSSYCYPDGTWDPNPDIAMCTVEQDVAESRQNNHRVEPQGVPCPKPTFTDPAVVITPEQDSYDTHETVTASCSSGTLLGDDVGVCLSDGTWEFTSDPSCLSDCHAPPNSNVTGSYAHASVVAFSCSQGFSLSIGLDSVASTCVDGAWSPPIACESTGCSPPSVPPKATIEDPQSYPYKYNSRVIMKCIGDRTLSGPAFSYCNKTGQWDPDPMTIKCLDQCVTPPFDDPKIIHTSQLSGSSGQSFYDHSDTIRFSCEGGIFVDGPWKAACHDGTWFPHIGGHRPVCKNNCTAPENMLNAGAVFHHSDSHVFECDGTPGMMRMGGPRSVCKHGVWTPRIRCALNKDLRSKP